MLNLTVLETICTFPQLKTKVVWIPLGKAIVLFLKTAYCIIAHSTVVRSSGSEARLPEFLAWLCLFPAL